MQEHRRQQGENLLATLDSLWDALDTPQDDLDRELFARLMSGPARLHQATMDKVCHQLRTSRRPSRTMSAATSIWLS